MLWLRLSNLLKTCVLTKYNQKLKATRAKDTVLACSVCSVPSRPGSIDIQLIAHLFLFKYVQLVILEKGTQRNNFR